MKKRKKRFVYGEISFSTLSPVRLKVQAEDQVQNEKNMKETEYGKFFVVLPQTVQSRFFYFGFGSC